MNAPARRYKVGTLGPQVASTPASHCSSKRNSRQSPF
jgi:hypothetical protein